MNPVDKLTILLVSSPEMDCERVETVLAGSQWKVQWVRSIREAVEYVQGRPADVVISERDLPDGSWKGLLEALAQMTNPPLLIVASLHADYTLWVEVLELGGFDVLLKPFEPEDLTWALRSAWLRRTRR